MGLKSGSKSGKGVKQGSTKLSTTKVPGAAKHATADEQDTDTSVMRPSIEISVSGIPHLVKAYQASTEELKSMMTRECDIIYECRVCRNLFRSLANMISHKRVYCKTSYSYTKHCLNRNHMIEDYTVVIEPEPASSDSQDKQDWKTSDEVPNIVSHSDNSSPQILKTKPGISSITKPKKRLREIVEKLTRNSGRNTPERLESKLISEAQLYDHINENVVARKNDSLEHSYHLEDIESSKVGKFQTKLVSSSSSTEKEDLMKAQVSELQNMASQSEAVIGPDGHTLSPNRHLLLSQNNPLEKTYESNCDSKAGKDEHVCPDCNVKFSTRKTLNHHMKSLHVTFRLCYPCPCCKSTFVNPWSVYRHLYKVHRKTAAQVRRMRPQIQKKAFRKEFHNEIPVTEVSPKNEALKELQRLDQENQTWMDNFEDDLELQRCGGCGRRFERRAALNSHSQICQKRIAARNNVKIVRSSPSTSSSDKVNKLPSEEQFLYADSIKKPNETSRILESVSDISNSLSLVRARQNIGNAWVDHQKKEVREKKIEIQIRKDYCKMSSSSSVLALSNDTQSEPSSRPPSRIVEDEESFDNERDWDSSVDLEEERKEESDSNDHINLSAQHSETLSSENSEKDDEKAVRNFSSTEDSESPLNFQDTFNCRDEVCLQQDKDFQEKVELPRKRKIEDNEYPIDSNKRACESFLHEHEGSVNTSCKNKKLEQFHPVMEARMKELINLKRLQCLPCQKKFIKLTNLRRHVAVHIGWCRYRCVLCPFKCFSKSDCVDHVSKIHLTRSQRNQAEAMVEYIEEQESEAITETRPEEETKEDIDTYYDEGSDTLSIEVHSLNIEDIKNIVGVISYNDDSNTCKSPKALELPRGSPSPKVNNKEEIKSVGDDTSKKTISQDKSTDEKLAEEKLNGDDVYDNLNSDVKSMEGKFSSNTDESNLIYSEVKEDCCEELHSSSVVNATEIYNGSSMKEIENLMEHILDSATENLNEDVVTKDFKKEEDEEVNPKCMEQVIECDKQNECSKIKSEKINNWSKAESFNSESKTCNDNLSVKTEFEPSSSYLIYDVERSESFQSPDGVSDRSEEDLNMNEKQSVCVESNQLLLRNDSPSSPENFDTNMSGKLDMEASETKDFSDEDSCHNSVNFKVKEDKPSDSLSKSEDGEIALRKMVMEVIFGSGISSNLDIEENHKLFTASMNGDVYECESVVSRSSRLSCSSDADVVFDDNNQLSSSESGKINSKLGIDVSTPFESERRERPVRNRVKVAKEDFIYDFTESFMKKEEQPRVKKRLTDSNKESNKSDSSTSHSNQQKPVPKLTLVRTDCSETIPSSHISGPIKGTWSSLYSSSSDLATSKSIASSSQMYSSRKISRIHDVKP